MAILSCTQKVTGSIPVRSTMKYLINVIDRADGQVKLMELSEAAYKKLLPPPDEAEEFFTPTPVPTPACGHVCADCGLETHLQNGPCARCRGYRIVLISMVEKLFGADWRSAFEPPGS